ncbi:MAG: HesA/MoeB/ThiF family protein [Rikenellaceae bacterium]|nr:HesA/MoeB/ThiF family protein [Rikenellaceae bacterium]
MEEEIYRRYQRNIIVPEFGFQSQEELLKSRVLVVGAGGLGSVILYYLTAAGVGTIGIVEYDDVDISNLQRQILYNTNDLSLPKINIAAERLNELNPDVNIERHNIRLDKVNSVNIIPKYDVVVDCTDNFETRYIIDDCCCKFNIPMVYGSAQGMTGQISVFDYKDGNSYGELYPRSEIIEDKKMVGVISPMPGIVGSMQAMEVIKLLTHSGDSLTGKLLTIDSYTMELRIFRIK